MWGGGACIPNPALTTQINNAYYHGTTTRLSYEPTQQEGGYYYAYPKLNTPSSSSSSSFTRSSSYGASSSSAPAEKGPPEEDNNNNNNNNNLPLTQSQQYQQSQGFWKQWKEKSAEMSSKLAKLGLSAVLAYGLFDAVTYTSFFVVAFLGYEKSTGQNPAANLKALIGKRQTILLFFDGRFSLTIMRDTGPNPEDDLESFRLLIVILMWAGNNVTRPFRVAGAAALAPIIDEGLKRIQKYFDLPSLLYAFALVVGVVAAPCLIVVGVLILSRWGK